MVSVAGAHRAATSDRCGKLGWEIHGGQTEGRRQIAARRAPPTLVGKAEEAGALGQTATIYLRIGEAHERACLDLTCTSEEERGRLDPGWRRGRPCLRPFPETGVARSVGPGLH